LTDKRLVIFDYDGTIADSRSSIAHCANLALDAVGRPAVPAAAVQALIGLPLREIFARLMRTDAAEPADEVVDAAVDAYRARYAEVDRSHSQLYDQMPELLAELKRAGVLLAIATGKSTEGAHRGIGRHGLDGGLFSMVLGSDAVPRPKPHPDMVVHILETLAVSPEETTVVGDTTFDMEMSVGARVDACGVTWGSHDDATLRGAGARWIVDTRAELRTLLLPSP